MILTRTPYRVSFLGGGTDYPDWFLHNGGLVVGGTINKYTYICTRHLPQYHWFKSRVVYSEIETVLANSEIRHLAVAKVLQFLTLHSDDAPGLEITHMSDVPGRSGLGSSSAFVVGLLHSLSTLTGRHILQHELAHAAIKVERELMGETGGWQDQMFVSTGGLNYIVFERSGAVNVFPLPLSRQAIRDLEDHLLLYYTGVSRVAAEVSKGYAGRLATDARFQWAMLKMADEGVQALLRQDWLDLGRLLDRSWALKRTLQGVTTPDIDTIYNAARMAGAVGGKLLGAGGGGCLLLVVPPEKKMSVACAMRTAGQVQVPFAFDFDGSRIVFVDSHNLSLCPSLLG